ncbi:MAG: HIT domain-containing protein [Actinocatenispora sp.]
MPIQLPATEVCSFCGTLSGRFPFTILENGPDVAIFVTREQRGLGHLLVLPIAHRPTVVDLAPAEAAAVMDGVQRAARAVSAAFDPAGICVWQNNGVPARQMVPHVHFHVAGTHPGGGTEWGPVPRLAITETDKLGELLQPHL